MLNIDTSTTEIQDLWTLVYSSQMEKNITDRQKRIDHILHSANMRSYNCKVDKVHYSDHYPMWCYLQLNE